MAYETSAIVKGGLVQVMDRLKVGAVLDVGANAGQFAQELRHGGYRGQIVSFEPQRDAYRLLEVAALHDPCWTTLSCALGDREESAVLNISENSVSSSILDLADRTQQAEPSTAYVAAETVEIRRLDRLWDTLSLVPDAVVMLKVDVQGYEFAVVEGATGVLDKISAVLLETSLVPVYNGERVLVDMLEVMRGRGFSPIWLKPGWSNADTGQVYQCDVLFCRSLDIA